MALPSSGQISMDDIRVELGVPTQSPFSLNTARQGGYVTLNFFSPTQPPYSGQVALSDWYSYCQSCGYYTYSLGYDTSLSSSACSASQATYYASASPLAIGVTIYTDIGGNAGSSGYYSNGTTWYQQDLGVGEVMQIIATGSCATTTTTTTSAVTYTNIGRFRSGTSVSCTSGGSNQFIYLNDTDYATYVSNGNLLSIGMILFSTSGGAAWNTSSYPLVYDPANLVVWSIGTFSEPGQIASVDQYC